MKDTAILNVIDPDLCKVLVSRRVTLRRVGGIAASTLSIPLALAVLSREAYGGGAFLPEQIKETLNFAYMLERLESHFYDEGLKAKGLIPAEQRAIFERIHSNEANHVRLLGTVLLGQKDEKEKFDFTAGGKFSDVFTNFQTFTALSQVFEDVGVRAYKGQAGNLISNDLILTVALRIHSVEARHAAEVRRLRGEKGWISGTSRGALPAFAQIAYDGDAVFQQGPVDLVGAVGSPVSDRIDLRGIAGVSDAAVTEAFDEPLTKEEVMAIVSPFIAG